MLQLSRGDYEEFEKHKLLINVDFFENIIITLFLFCLLDQ